MKTEDRKKKGSRIPKIVANSTLTECAEKIICVISNSLYCGLTDAEKKCKDAFAQFRKKYSFTDFQIIVVSLLLNEEPSGMKLGDITRKLDMTLIGYYNYSQELDELVKQRYLFSSFDLELTRFMINPSIRAAILHDEAARPMPYEKFENIHWIRTINRIVDSADISSDIDEDLFRSNLEDVLKNTKHLEVSRAILAEDFAYDDFVIVMAALAAMYEGGGCSSRGFAQMFADDWLMKERWYQLGEKEDPLTEKGWIERCITSDGFASSRHVRVPLAKLQDVLPDIANIMGDNHVGELKKLNCIQPNDIKAKQLYYNPNEEGTVKRLVGLLDEEHYKQTCNRLEEKGFRRGFTALLYGAPGTGKTETVMQIAKATGRQIRQVKISEIRDKYVGETEKRIQQVFDSYRLMVRQAEKRGENTPILLFNEADGILHKRFELSGSNPTVAEMENAMQNIILEEMEKLEGILICTSNLTEQLDPAMERRFLFKIMLSQPKADVAAHIWEEMIPELTHDEATDLAREFHFSGGQIENIARKQTIDYILEGKEMNVQYLKRLCKEEMINNKNNRKVGF